MTAAAILAAVILFLAAWTAILQNALDNVNLRSDELQRWRDQDQATATYWYMEALTISHYARRINGGKFPYLIQHKLQAFYVAPFAPAFQKGDRVVYGTQGGTVKRYDSFERPIVLLDDGRSLALVDEVLKREGGDVASTEAVADEPGNAGQVAQGPGAAAGCCEAGV
jgi:hypothetical protein